MTTVLMTLAERQRFLPKFALGEGPTACWEWQASLTTGGYGQFYFRGRPHPAHRLAYAEFNGPLPDGCDVVMHTCDNRRCVNPAHLVPGTVTLNNLDRDRKGRNRIDAAHAVVYANRAAQTHCKYGHEFTPDNTWLYQPSNRPGPRRVCLACKKASRPHK